jgi:hypothetical protein
VPSHVLDRVEVVKRSGRFLLARFHLESLIGKTTPNEITVILETLPKGENALAQAYGKTITRIRNQEQGFRFLAERVLSLLTSARRLRTILELRHALAVEVGTSKLDEGDLPCTNIIVAVCAGLVAVDYVGGTIRLLHDTTRDYLETHVLHQTSEGSQDTGGPHDIRRPEERHCHG